MPSDDFKDQLSKLAPKLGLSVTNPQKELISKTGENSSLKVETLSSNSLSNMRRALIQWLGIGLRGLPQEGILFKADPKSVHKILKDHEDGSTYTRTELFFCLLGFMEILQGGAKKNDTLFSLLIDFAPEAYHFEKSNTLSSLKRLLVRNCITHKQHDDLKSELVKKPFSPQAAKLRKKLSMGKNFVSKTISEKTKAFRVLQDSLKIDKILNSISTIPVELEAPDLSKQDIGLSLSWLDQSLSGLKNLWDTGQISLRDLVEQYGNNYELGRVLSARAAEKAAKHFYEISGWKVEDTSLSQDSEGNNGDWKYFDLLVDSYSPIDVKNSRRSLSSPDRYVEHCVPKFKKDSFNREIKIAGVLSNYLRPKDILDASIYLNDDLIFLGQTSMNELENLKTDFSSDSFVISFKDSYRNSNASFLPPWVFGYPQFSYVKRDEIIDSVVDINLPEMSTWVAAEINALPFLLISRKGKEFIANNKVLNFKWEFDFFESLRNLILNQKLSLPYLYCNILKHFISVVRKGSDHSDQYSPSKYHQFLYLSNKHTKTPLFLCDPLSIIQELINALNTLWRANHDLISRFIRFRLINGNIFQGQQETSETWKTLVAYCGGWVPGKAKCGKNPLVLGRHKHCETCGKLICDVCGFCSRPCPSYKERTQK